MKLLLVLAIILPYVFGKCCMPERFSAKATYTSGSKEMGDLYIYVDFGSKRVTIQPIRDDPNVMPALKAMRLDFGTGTLHKHFNLLDQCSETSYKGLEGFDRCIPDNAKPKFEPKEGSTDEDWEYKISSGMMITIYMEKKDCLPYFFQLSDPSKYQWTEQDVWSSILSHVTVNETGPGVKTVGCSDDGDIFG